MMVLSKCTDTREENKQFYYYMGKERMQSVDYRCFEGLKTEYPSEGTIFYFSCFKDKEEYKTYINLVDKVKMEIAEINEEHADGKLYSSGYKRKLEKIWIPLVKEMFGKFGEDMIPHYIRWAYNDVLQTLKKPQHTAARRVNLKNRVTPLLPTSTNISLNGFIFTTTTTYL
jgi:hypothetical protein